MEIWNKTCNFDFFFSKNFFQPYERARRVGHENRSLRSQKLTLDLKKIPEGLKMNRKSQNYFHSFCPVEKRDIINKLTFRK